MRFLILAGALVALSAPAFADTPWTAKPVQPSTQTGFVGDSALWDCTATSGCTTESDTSGASPMTECRGLAAQLGQLSSFSGGGETFDATRLAHCNADAKKP